MAIIKKQPLWTKQEDDRLRILWEAEWPTLQIAAALKRSKSAITGRVHRIGLPKRKSPIPVKVCPDQVHAMRVRMRQLEAGIEAAREELARAA